MFVITTNYFVTTGYFQKIIYPKCSYSGQDIPDSVQKNISQIMQLKY